MLNINTHSKKYRTGLQSGFVIDAHVSAEGQELT